MSAPTPAWVVVPVTEIQPNTAGLVGLGATVPLQWTNYCDDVMATSFRVTLPEAGGVLDRVRGSGGTRDPRVRHGAL